VKNLKQFHQKRVVKYLNQVLPILLSCGYDNQTLMIRVKPKIYFLFWLFSKTIPACNTNY